MKLRAALGALAVFATSALLAQEKTVIAYRFPLLEGKTAVYEAERSVTTVAEGTDDEGKPLASTKISSTTAQTIAITFESCLESEARIVVTTRRLRSTIRQDSDEFVYDSEKPPEGEVPPEFKQAASLVGQRVVLRVTRKGDVLKVDGAAKGTRVEDFKGTFVPLPGDARAVGERWVSKQRAPLGEPPVGELVTTYNYKLASLEGEAPARRARIDAAIDVAFEALRGAIGVPLVTVRDGGGKGHALIDAANGLLVEEETETHMTLVSRSDSGARPTQRIEGRSHQKLVSLEDAKKDGK